MAIKKVGKRTRQRAIDVSMCYVYNDLSIRELAEKFNTNKTSIYVDLSERIHVIDEQLGKLVKEKMEENKNDMYKRAGASSTRRTNAKIQEVKDYARMKYEGK